MVHSLTTLPSGLRVVSEKRPDLRLHHIYLCVGVGSMDESEKEMGLSHFIEHCVFNGTKNRPNENDVWKTVESIGGSLNAYTTKDHTSFFCMVLEPYLEKGMELLSDIVLNPLFEKDAVAREKKVIEGERVSTESNFVDRHHKTLVSSLFENHPIAHEILGTQESIANVSGDMVASYHSKHYRTSNMALAVVGPAEHQKIVDIASKAFPKMPVSDQKEWPTYAPLLNNIEKSVEHNGNESLAIIGFRCPDVTESDSLCAEFISHCMSNMATFGLRNIIRFDKRLSYSVMGGYSGYRSGSYSIAYTVCSKANQIHIANIMSEFIDLLIREKLNEQTTNALKNNYLGNYLASIENPGARASNMAYFALNDLMHLADKTKQINALTPDDILNFANKYFKRYALLNVSAK